MKPLRFKVNFELPLRYESVVWQIYSHLKANPKVINKTKQDKIFVRDVYQFCVDSAMDILELDFKNGENIEIIKAIMNLARDLDIGVIAEGIETENQFDMLKDLKCEFGQGFFFAKPMDFKAIESLLDSNPSLADVETKNHFDQLAP